MTIEIIEEGLHTTIQDQGRLGYQSYGFSVSGPMDEFAAKMANILVNNDTDEALIEMSFIGPTIKFHQHAIIAITGGNMSANLNDRPIPLAQPIQVKKGDILQFRTVKTGGFGYMAIKGGLDIPEILGSQSTVVRAEVEGVLRGKLAVGDMISFSHSYKTENQLHWGITPALFNYIEQPAKVIRYLEGPQYDWFESDTFEQTKWTASTRSNRMGYLLEGNPIKKRKDQQLLTEATSFGSIQVPPNGQPIILMADGQPTGGYPKIGQVARVDLSKVSQLRPGQPFRFQKITVDEAIILLQCRDRLIRTIQRFCQEKWGGIKLWQE
ncbi:biotin-dependent carboxyltransferase family protein [Gracilibacillus thailandensis]|uniref:5-oxoprolinase/urea amidolyase family protein n=1 Tax=Gracilibacillus thailandensis TaxID=563735 RepID=A0A6N7R1G7_9BACI|nr:biotin-dependent carboxyltransferase family protein [Gracilibacillus thailandensis]MRI67235.1 5-oxoprolinase/urea amidolyase family protein [Gracilibacillus thailandensis]